MLTRWAKRYEIDSAGIKRNNSLVSSAHQITPTPNEIVWPDVDLFRSDQSNSMSSRASVVLDKADSLFKKSGCIWILEDSLELQLKVLVASHCGSLRHRGRDATESTVREDFFWKSLKKDVAQFVNSCIHFLANRAGEHIPRPLATALHAERPNEVLHVDYLFMGASSTEQKYVLLIRDDLSGYVWLWSTTDAPSDAAAGALSMWIGVFGGFEWWVSDQGSHFKNRVMDELTREFHVAHHFTTAYSPWANGILSESVATSSGRARHCSQSGAWIRKIGPP